MTAFSDDSQLPFEDGTFELVINRHEAYDPQELRRIMAPGGTFIPQQVGDRNDRDLANLFGVQAAPDDEPWNKDMAAGQLRAAGLEVLDAREDFPLTRTFDVGALAYYFKAIPWEIPDFSVEKYFEPLIRLHERIGTEGYLDVRSHRFLVVAVKLA